MGQRLNRAKLKIKAARIRFEAPDAGELAPRLAAVLAAIYAAYTSGWDDVIASDARRGALTAEAVMLARLVCELAPDEPEALGLAALVLHCEARRAARLGPGGAFVPLLEQDPSLWDGELIDEAEAFLSRASAHGRMGRYQLEAAIQSAHVERARTGGPDWNAVLLLYDGLVAATPSLGAAVGRIAALAQARGPCAALAELAALPERAVRTYQPFWALTADLNARAGRTDEAADAYDRAIGLSADAALRAFLIRRKSELT
jgi:RNA polymerase sigma-70 factor (ECF subfamily)